MEYKTPKQYADEHPEVEWHSIRDSFELYRMNGSRFRVIAEQPKPPHDFDHLWVRDQHAEAGVDESTLDSEAFADDFIEHFCNQLSLRDLSILIPKMQAFYDKWEASRHAAASKL